MDIPVGVLANISGAESYAHINPDYYYLLERGLEGAHSAVAGAQAPPLLESHAMAGWTETDQNLQTELAAHRATAEGQRTAELVAIADRVLQEASQREHPNIPQDRLRASAFLSITNLGRTATTTFLEDKLILERNTLNDPEDRRISMGISKPANDLGSGVKLQISRSDLALAHRTPLLAEVHVSDWFAFANLTYYGQGTAVRGNFVRVPGFLDAVLSDINEFAAK